MHFLLPQAAGHLNLRLDYLLCHRKLKLQSCSSVILRPNRNISPLSCKYFALYPLSPPSPAPRPPKYQNLWVSIFPVENYHSLSL